MGIYLTTDTNLSDGESNVVLEVSFPCHDHSDRYVHYYVDVPNSQERTFDACERSVGIDPTFCA